MPQIHSWDRPLELDHHDMANHAPILTPEEARQGVVSGRVRLVLVVSLTLALVAFAILYAVYA